MEPTRTVRMWIDNDGPLHNTVFERTEDTVRRHIEGHGVPADEARDALEGDRDVIAEVADAIRTSVNEKVQGDVPDRVCLTSDLVSSALRSVDWWELAEEWLDATLDEAEREGVESLTRL